MPAAIFCTVKKMAGLHYKSGDPPSNGSGDQLVGPLAYIVMLDGVYE